jgi:hypothetical protein
MAAYVLTPAAAFGGGARGDVNDYGIIVLLLILMVVVFRKRKDARPPKWMSKQKSAMSLCGRR